MARARICAAITNNDIKAVRKVEPVVDLYEVRIDLIGDSWEKLITQLRKPWIACNRIPEEGGRWQGNEARRIEKLLQAIELGAGMVDVELRTKNLENIVPLIKKRTRCLLSSHDLEKKVVQRQLKAGADICKVVTTAHSFEDNLAVLQLITESPDTKIVTGAMGPLGHLSRVLGPLVGGDFTYASMAKGKESAPGQITIMELRKLYEMVVR